jgi:hypothetical protein
VKSEMIPKRERVLRWDGTDWVIAGLVSDNATIMKQGLQVCDFQLHPPCSPYCGPPTLAALAPASNYPPTEPMATSPACSKRSSGRMRSGCRPIPPVQPTGLMGPMCLLGPAGAFLPILAEQLKIETDCVRNINNLH